MQRTKLIVYPILATILLILVFQFVENKSRNISVEEYFYQNSDEFTDIVDVLRQNKVEGFPLYPKTISKHFLGMQIKMLVQKQYALCSKRLIAMPSMPQQPVLEISIAVLRAEDMMQ
jgi:hypothetical protein